MNDHRCDACGWVGPRTEREVNYSHLVGLWLCRVCYLRSRGR